MENKEIENIIIIGSGNVATQLAITLQKAGKNILQVYGRKESMAKCLSSKLKVDYITDLKHLQRNADLYILAIIDDALLDISANIDLDEELIVHTSGTVSLDVFKDHFKNYGVFYPLQTFSKEKNISFDEIPICVESNSESNQWKLMKLGEQISHNVKAISSEQRKLLHVSAVFACNFTNYFYSIAEELMADHDMPFELLLPLIKETADKLNHHLPHEGQTGPARRNDQEIMAQHLKMLSNYPEYQDIYQILSERIKRKHHK